MKKLLTLFTLLLCVCSGAWGQDLIYSHGFENGTDSWSKSSMGSATSESTVKRTGGKSLSYTCSNATGYARKGGLTYTKGYYIHAIMWVKSTEDMNFTIKLNGDESSPFPVNNSDWTRIYHSINYTGSTGTKNTDVLPHSATGSFYIDDVVLYYSSSSTTDLTAPTSATSASATASAISWTVGTDANTGVQKTLIFKRTNGSADDLTLNDQGIYSLTPTEGPSTDQSGHWTLVAVVNGNATSYEATLAGDTRYAIVHRDLAYNYSTPTYVTTPSTVKYDVTYKANGSGEDDIIHNVSTVEANMFTWTGHIFIGWNTKADGKGTDYAVGDAVTGDLELFAQWIEGTATTITYNLKTNSSSTTLDNCTSATPNSGSIIASADINTYGTAGCEDPNSAKENETQKLKIDGEYTAGNYYEWTFTEDNCTFAPTSVQIKFQSVSGLVQYKVALTDGITTKTTNFVQTTSAANTLETLDWKITDGTVFAANQTIKLQLWAYKKDSNAAAFRLGSPITINGIVKTIPSTVSGTITEAGWNTFSCNYALNLSTITGGTAYVAKTNDNTEVTMTKTTAKIAAGTGIMIKGTAGDTFTISTTTDAATLYADNQLVGLPNGGIVAAGEYNFVFAWEKEKVSTAGFYYVDIAAPTLPAGKAYLNSEGVNGAKLSIVIDDTPSQEETDGIKSVQGSGFTVNGEAYNLSGQRVGADYKGLVIINGKKVIRK